VSVGVIDEPVAVVAVCAQGARADLQLARLFAQLPRSLGIGPARLAWVEMSAGAVLPTLPDVRCYLFIGSAIARAGAAQLSLTQQNQATIAVCAEPQELLAGAPARRALWQAIKPLARRLRKGG
jgi:DNA polymerase III psi subunit